jgi:hypothetical protein
MQILLGACDLSKRLQLQTGLIRFSDSRCSNAIQPLDKKKNRVVFTPRIFCST